MHAVHAINQILQHHSKCTSTSSTGTFTICCRGAEATKVPLLGEVMHLWAGRIHIVTLQCLVQVPAMNVRDNLQAVDRRTCMP